MKKTKLVAVAAATLMAATAAGALAGCGSDPAYTLNVFLLANSTESEVYDEYFEHMEDEFAADGLNYKIKARYEQENNYYSSLDALINGDDTPDIFYLRPNEILQYKTEIVSLQSYADAQTDVNLSDIYPLAINMYRYNPTTGALGNEDDDLYAFPKDLSTQQLGYNRELLEQFTSAIKAAWSGYVEPWNKDFSKGTYTWEQYKTICKAIADNANANSMRPTFPPSRCSRTRSAANSSTSRTAVRTAR